MNLISPVLQSIQLTAKKILLRGFEGKDMIHIMALGVVFVCFCLVIYRIQMHLLVVAIVMLDERWIVYSICVVAIAVPVGTIGINLYLSIMRFCIKYYEILHYV